MLPREAGQTSSSTNQNKAAAPPKNNTTTSSSSSSSNRVQQIRDTQTNPFAQPPKQQQVQEPGIQVTQNQQGEIITRVTLRPGESSNLRWEQKENTAEFKGTITQPQKSPGIQPTPRAPSTGQKISEAFTKPGRQFWYGNQTGPEIIAVSNIEQAEAIKAGKIPPGYIVQPSVRSIMAESFANIGIGLSLGGIVRIAAPAAESATGILRTINKASKVVMGGSIGTQVGADTVKTYQEISSGTATRSVLSTRVLQYGVGFGSFGITSGAFERPLQSIQRPRMRSFNERQMVESEYIRNIYGYRSPGTTQISLPDFIASRKYLVTGKETIPLESSMMKAPEVRLSSAERTSFKNITDVVEPRKTTQLSMYGAKVYEKPVETVMYKSKVPWRVEQFTKETKLPETDTWTNIRYENGKLVTEEIPRSSVRFFKDTRAQQSLMILRERPSIKFNYEPEMMTKAPITGFKIPSFLLLPAQRTYQMPSYNQDVFFKTISIQLPIFRHGEMQSSIQESDLRRMLKEDTRAINADLSKIETMPMQKQGQQQRQIQESITRQIQKSISRSTGENITDNVNRIIPGVPGLFTAEKKQSINEQETQGYNVYVKERSYVHGHKRYPESWKKLNTKPVSEEAALSLGGTAVDQSAAASFKIKQTSGKASKLGFNVDPWVALSYKFSQRNGVYIENTNSRIDSSGEIKGISALGWLENQRRAMAMPRMTYGASTPVRASMIKIQSVDINKLMRGWGV